MQSGQDKPNLALHSPAIASDWHPTRNAPLTPADVRPKSDKKVWWRCGQGHVWNARIADRVSKKSKCPFCAGRLPSANYNLSTRFPHVAAEWHDDRNEPLLPTDVTPFSSKKVWWRCSAGHEWQAPVARRTNGRRGCPYCSGRYASHTNSLLDYDPTLAKQWHPTKNGALRPRSVTPSSTRRVWWLCSNGHEWEASVANRTRGTACPYCSNKKVNAQNSLAVSLPELVDQWDCEKNNGVTPHEVTAGSGRIVWWRCSRGHSWPAAVKDRARGSGCPQCSPNTSKMEIRIFTELSVIFESVGWRVRVAGRECDIYLQDHKLAVEIDGYYWHKDKRRKDEAKNAVMRAEGIEIIRVREPELPRLSDHDVIQRPRESQISVLHRLLAQIARIRPDLRERIDRNTAERRYLNDSEYRQICASLPGPPSHLSLQLVRPGLAAEWHVDRNYPLQASHFSVGSNYRAWWQCERGHEWRTAINNRNNGSNCPYCSGHRATTENCLATAAPDVASEWHPEKNGGLNPSDVTRSSGKRVWWKCRLGHEWQARVGDRVRGIGCPYCSGRRASDRNNLQALKPEVAREWHPTKNGDLRPHHVTLGSGREVWWLCDCGHEWKKRIRYRASGSKCPACR